MLLLLEGAKGCAPASLRPCISERRKRRGVERERTHFCRSPADPTRCSYTSSHFHAVREAARRGCLAAPVLHACQLGHCDRSRARHVRTTNSASVLGRIRSARGLSASSRSFMLGPPPAPPRIVGGGRSAEVEGEPLGPAPLGPTVLGPAIGVTAAAGASLVPVRRRFISGCASRSRRMNIGAVLVTPWPGVRGCCVALVSASPFSVFAAPAPAPAAPAVLAASAADGGEEGAARQASRCTLSVAIG